MPRAVRCLICGAVIGVHEPLLVVGATWGRTSSLAREPLLGSGEEIIMHRACGLQFPAADDIEPSEGDPPELQ